MRVTIPKPQRDVLLRMPAHTPVLLGLDQDWKTAALVIRVEDLIPFRVPELPIQVGFALYRSDAGTWLVSVPFRVYDSQDDPLDGDAYLNPQQQADYALLENLARQELFPFVFLAWNLKDAVTKAIPWRLQGEAVKALGAVDASIAGKLGGSFDPDFETAKREFQARFTVGQLLKGGD